MRRVFASLAEWHTANQSDPSTADWRKSFVILPANPKRRAGPYWRLLLGGGAAADVAAARLNTTPEQRWAADAKLRAEFGTLARYIAYERARDKGWVK